MSGKKIYSAELKLEIVQRYLQGGISLKALAEEYHVGKSDIQKWKAAYAEHGTEALYEERRGRASKMGTKKQENRKIRQIKMRIY